MQNKFKKIINSQKNKQNLITGIRFLIIILISSMIIFHVFFAFCQFDSIPLRAKFLLAISLKILLALLIIYLVLQANRKLINHNTAAKQLDSGNKDKADTYQNAWELSGSGNNINHDLLALILQKADNKSENQSLYISYHLIKKLILPFVALLLGTGLFIVILPVQVKDTIDFFYMKNLPAITHKDFVELEPGNAKVLKNENFKIKVINPEPETEHTLFYRLDKNWREIALPELEKTFFNLDYSFDYYIKTPYATSDTFSVKVFEEPLVQTIRVRYDYPDYTKMKTYYDTQSIGHIKAIKGTSVILEIDANNDLEETKIFFSDASVKEMERIGKKSFKTEFEIKQNGTYHIKLIDFLKNESRKLEKSITIIQDKKPEIDIVYPGRDTILTQNMLMSLEFFAMDDFGLKNLILYYSINGQSENEIMIQEVIKENPTNIGYVFDLAMEVLMPGDYVTYWASVTDNSPDFQESTSKQYKVRFPSIEEIYEEIELEEEMKSAMLEDNLEKAKELKEEFEQKQRELFKKEEYDWQDKKDMEQLLKKQENLNQEMENVAEDYQKLIEKFQDNQALSSETIEKMSRIKELMDEINNEDLQKAMQDMAKSMENMDPDIMKKAMENFKFSMDDYIEKLDQTIDLLEDIKKEQALQKSLEISEEMQQMQEQLNQKTENSEKSGEELAKEQKNISDKLDKLTEQLEKTSEMMNDENSELSEAMKELQEQMEKDNLSEDLQNSEQALQNNQKQQAQESQQQASQKMQQMTQKLNEMKQMMSASGMQQMTEEIQKTIQRLLILSNLHESSQDSFGADPFMILPQQIANYEGINRSLQKLYSVPQIVLYISPKFTYDVNLVQTNYRDMFKDINDAKNRKVKTYLKNIQKGINMMIYDLMQSNNQMQQGGGSGSAMQQMMQSMQMMSQQQMMMNMMSQEIMQQMQQMQQGGKNGRISKEMRDSMQKLARDEQRLADNLKRMLQNNPEAQKQGSSIQKMIEDLESIAKKLRSNRIDQDLIDRQQRILSRMLDTQKSIHKREFSKKRKAETADTKDWQLPEGLDLDFKDIKRKALLEEDMKEFPNEYQEVIKEYLKKLNEKINNN